LQASDVGFLALLELTSAQSLRHKPGGAAPPTQSHLFSTGFRRACPMPEEQTGNYPITCNLLQETPGGNHSRLNSGSIRRASSFFSQPGRQLRRTIKSNASMPTPILDVFRFRREPTESFSYLGAIWNDRDQASVRRRALGMFDDSTREYDVGDSRGRKRATSSNLGERYGHAAQNGALVSMRAPGVDWPGRATDVGIHEVARLMDRCNGKQLRCFRVRGRA